MGTRGNGPDRFLVAIVACIVVLVVAVVAVALSGGPPAYKPDDTPAGVAHNYLLSLRQGDYARAYGYLAPGLAHYPADLDRFVQDMRRDAWSFNLAEGSVSLAVDRVVPGETQTIVQVGETRYHLGGLFDSGEYGDTFDLVLKLEQGEWKIVEGGRYWSGCWSSTSDDCK